MKRTILLGTINKFPMKFNLWGSTIAGLFFIANGVIHIFSDIAHPIGLIIGIIMIPVGIGYSIYGILSFNESSKYAPRFSLNEEELLFKESLMKPPIVITWDRIKKIKFGPLHLDITTGESEMAWGYMTNDKTSKQIKETIRELAESKNIEVIGG
ncbi:MAG: hypothetical protein ACFHWX_17725 [Bacteroidota bacterium]